MHIRILLLVLSTLSGSVLADSPIWQVSNGHNKVYIGGTMHMLSQHDFPLPSVFDKAYNDADILVFETDIDQLQQPEFQQLSLQLLTYQDGTSLKDVLQPATIAAVQKHLNARGMSLDSVLHFKPSFLGLMLTVVEFKIMGLSDEGVDQYFYDRSNDDQKAHLYFESPRQQLDFMANLGSGDEDHYVLYSLAEISNAKQDMQSMRQQWRSGDFNAMANTMLIPMQQDFPSVYQSLILNRNNDWLPQVTQMLDTSATEMILVGALHLAGENGILNQLKQLGYQVEEVH